MELITSELIHNEVIFLTPERKEEMYSFFARFA
jgi:hypothetical protein